MRITTLIALTLALSVLNSGCDSEPSTAEMSAEQGDAMAQNNLGVMYQKGEGVPQDYKEAVKWYRLAAEQGHATAQTNLGGMYYKGQGVPEDYK